MSGPAYYTAEIEMALNEDWVVPFLYAALNPDGSTTPIDLTGSVLTMEFRHVDIDHEVVIAATSTNNDGIIITDAPNGLFTIAITRQSMVNVRPGDYVADLVRLMPNTYQERMIDCIVTIVEGVTR